jgi:hypothetical protein
MHISSIPFLASTSNLRPALIGYSRDTCLSQIWDKYVYAMNRVMPHEVGERAIGAGFITFPMA